MTRRADVATRRPGFIFPPRSGERPFTGIPGYGGALEPGSANAALGQLLALRSFLRIYLSTPYADALAVFFIELYLYLLNFSRVNGSSVETCIN